SSLKFRFKLPSNKIIPTATEIIGSYNVPKSSWGFIMLKNGPTSNTATAITTIAAIQKRQEIHCEPIPRNPISIISNNTDGNIRSLLFLKRYTVILNGDRNKVNKFIFKNRKNLFLTLLPF